MYVKLFNGQTGPAKGEMLSFSTSMSSDLFSLPVMKAADILKVSDKEDVVENQIKGEGHLWRTLPADTALLKKQFKLLLLVKDRPLLLRLHVIK